MSGGDNCCGSNCQHQVQPGHGQFSVSVSSLGIVSMMLHIGIYRRGGPHSEQAARPSATSETSKSDRSVVLEIAARATFRPVPMARFEPGTD